MPKAGVEAVTPWKARVYIAYSPKTTKVRGLAVPVALVDLHLRGPACGGSLTSMPLREGILRFRLTAAPTRPIRKILPPGTSQDLPLVRIANGTNSFQKQELYLAEPQGGLRVAGILPARVEGVPPSDGLGCGEVRGRDTLGTNDEIRRRANRRVSGAGGRHFFSASLRPPPFPGAGSPETIFLPGCPVGLGLPRWQSVGAGLQFCQTGGRGGPRSHGARNAFLTSGEA